MKCDHNQWNNIDRIGTALVGIVGNDVIVVVAKLGVITAVQLYDDESGSRQKSIATIITSQASDSSLNLNFLQKL